MTKNCLFCENGCPLCKPNNDHIPEWYTVSKSRPTQNHNVKIGLHPMGYRLLGAGIGETCGNCKHLMRLNYHNNRYHKCAKMKVTHSNVTDILVKWAGCEKWELEIND